MYCTWVNVCSINTACLTSRICESSVCADLSSEKYPTLLSVANEGLLSRSEPHNSQFNTWNWLPYSYSSIAFTSARRKPRSIFGITGFGRFGSSSKGSLLAFFDLVVPSVTEERSERLEVAMMNAGKRGPPRRGTCRYGNVSVRPVFPW